MFDCPNCGAKTPKLIGSTTLKKVVCPNCYIENRKPYVGLWQRLMDIVKGHDLVALAKTKAR